MQRGRRYNASVSTHSLSLSSEVADLKRSVMRDLLRLAVDPGIVSLAARMQGLPGLASALFWLNVAAWLVV